MTCPSRDDLVAYSLGALEADEERSLESHLPGCERCTRELRALAPAVAVLGESVEQLKPPPELRQRLMDAVQGEAAQASQAKRARPAAHSGRSRLGTFLLRPAAGLAALAFVGAGVAGYVIRDEEGDGGGGTDTVPVDVAGTGAGGSLEVTDDSAVLAVHGMPPLARGAVYQVWVARDGEVTPASSFVPDPAGSATAAVPEHLRSGDRVMVTREPRMDRTTPTLPPVLSARVD